MFLVCTLLLCGCGRPLDHKPGYIATGKILCGAQAEAPSTTGADGVPTKTHDAMFFGTQIEILESGEIRRRALERVRALHPELQETDVAISVTQSKASAVLTVAAVGVEPEYTRVSLDALLDEYIAFVREIAERANAEPRRNATADVLEKERIYREAIVKLEGARQNHAVPEVIADLQVKSDAARIGFESAMTDEAKAQTSGPALQGQVFIMERPGPAVENR